MNEIAITWGPNRELVTRLAEAGAHLVIAGGTAVKYHVPERREPGDLDLLVEASAETLVTLNSALGSLGAPVICVPPERFARGNARYSEKMLLNVDILTAPTGFSFAQAWNEAQEVTMDFSQTRLRVAGIVTLEHLLRLAREREPARATDFDADLQLLARAKARSL